MKKQFIIILSLILAAGFAVSCDRADAGKTAPEAPKVKEAKPAKDDSVDITIPKVEINLPKVEVEAPSVEVK